MLRKGAIVVSDSQRVPVSQLFVSCEKERWGESPISQPKGPEQKYSVSTLQDGRVVPIKGNVVTRGQNVQDRPEGCILCNPPVSEIQKICQILVERPSARVLLLLLRAFSSSSSFNKTIRSPSLSLLSLSVSLFEKETYDVRLSLVTTMR